MILNYRHDRLAITPSMQLLQSPSYGGPYDVAGVDPRTCGNNISNTKGGNIAAGDPGADPLQCDYLSLLANQAGGATPQLFIPNPQNGNTFAKPGQFGGPWQAIANLAVSYDLSPRVTATVTLANLYHTCFGGDSKPWTSASPPGKNVCSYAPASQISGPGYISNYYNGTSALDTKANGVTPYPWQLQSYIPEQANEGVSVPYPFNAYFSVTVKI